ncbi:hypothetical protein BDZ97DRAFT_810070 [Flammula alnicola]|nr:hypothetical protein BDZ97DRAFT_810070 [Flammula alnicola]
MPFTDSFRKVTINKGVLSAECKKSDNKTWISSSINLDEFLGNVDGKFTLGGKGFSQSAQDITLADGVISAKLKNATGKYVDAKFDLSQHVHSNDGIIGAKGIIAVQGVGMQVGAVGLDRSFSASSAASAASAASMSSMSSSQSTSMTSVSQHSSSSTKTFSSSKFRYQQLLIEETCTNFVLKGTFLHCDIHHEDGRVSHASFDLDLCIGNVDGRLVWDASGFSKTCTAIALDGLFLTAKCRHPIHHDEYIFARLDLRTRLRNQGGVIIFVETNKKLSMMLSEVPWMKFKVIAEPDLSVFGSHPVVKQTMTRIAESTVEHVTLEMHKMLTIAMEEAIVAVTASAMKHIAVQMEHTVQDAVGYAVASPSATESEFLHIGGGAMYGGMNMYGGAAYGGAAYGGAAYSSGSMSAGASLGMKGGASLSGGLLSGGAMYSNGSGASSATSLSRSVSESSSVSSAISAAHSESSAYSASTATKTAAAHAAAVTQG